MKMLNPNFEGLVQMIVLLSLAEQFSCEKKSGVYPQQNREVKRLHQQTDQL